MMIIIKKLAYTKGEVQKLRELFDIYIKTVIDIEKKVCCAGCDRHFECEELLLKQGSKQKNIWGGGIDLETKTIDMNSMVNIRPRDDNRSNEIQNPEKRKTYEELTKYYFQEIL